MGEGGGWGWGAKGVGELFNLTFEDCLEKLWSLVPRK